MTNSTVDKYSTPPALERCKSKATARYNFTLVRTALLKRQNVSVGEDVRREPFMLFGADGNWSKQFGKYMAFPLTTINRSKDVAHW